MKPIAIALLCLIIPAAARAQNTPVGLWKTIDDDTKKETSLVRISEVGGVVSGRIEALLEPSDQDAVCDRCRDERKGQPLVGMAILGGLRQSGDVWKGGKILDPDNGKLYNVRLKPIDNGQKLEVRGSVGPFSRTQTWIRVE